MATNGLPMSMGRLDPWFETHFRSRVLRVAAKLAVVFVALTLICAALQPGDRSGRTMRLTPSPSARSVSSRTARSARRPGGGR